MDSGIPSQWAGNIGYQATATAVVCLIFDVAVLSARAISRAVTKARAGWDDWLLIPAGLFNIALCSIVIYGPQNDGLGQHETAVYLENPNELVVYAKNQLAFISFYSCCCSFPKLVLLVLYLRIFNSRGFRIATFVLMGITITYTIVAIITTMLMCIPLSALWDTTITTAKCIDLTAWFAYSTVPNIVIDAAVLALPIPSLLSLKLPLRDRIGLVLTFSAGGIGTLGGIARTVVNARINGVTDDVTWSGVPLSIVALVEVTLYLIAACMPGLRPLYLRIRGKGQYSGRNQSYYADNSSHRTDRTNESSMPISQKLSSTNATSDGMSKNSINGHRSLLPEEREARDAQERSPIAYPQPGIQVQKSYEVRRFTNGAAYSGKEALAQPSG